MNPALVTAKRAELTDRVQRIRKHLPASPQQLAADRDALDLVSFNLMLAVQACGDIASHLIADDAHYPALMDAHTSLPPCGESTACPSNNRFVVLHEDGLLSLPGAGGEDIIDLVDLGFPQEGISYPAASIDNAIENDDLLDTNRHIDQAAYGNLLQTSFTTLTNVGAHGSMAENSKLVVDRNATPQVNALHAAEYYLLPVYLQAFCDIGQ